jgi:opacity protein-like surface antigen
MKNLFSFYLPCVGLLLCSLAHADGVLTEPMTMHWKPLVGIGGGVASTGNLGASQTFPIQNPVADEYYLYSPSHQTQTQGLFEVFLGAEHALPKNWRMQAGLAYNQSGTYNAQGTFIQGADAGSADQYAYNYHVVGRELLAQAKFMHPYRDKFYPYFLLGLGGSLNKSSAYSTNAPPFLTFTREYLSNTAHSFAYKLGLGVDMDLTQHARIGLAYRFSGLGSVALGSASIDSIAVSGTLSQSNLYANEVLVQLTYLI